MKIVSEQGQGVMLGYQLVDSAVVALRHTFLPTCAIPVGRRLLV